MTPFHVYLYGPNQGAMQSSFEEAEARLAQLPRLCFEPDGSFVWTLPSGREQLFGMLYDAGGKVRYCDIQGQCTRATWQQLCRAISGGDQGGLVLMRLPELRLQDLQSFEAECLADLPADFPPTSS